MDQYKSLTVNRRPKHDLSDNEEENEISLLQESHEFIEELAFVQQKLNVTELEKIEYETEINRLNQENKKLLEENESFYEAIKTKQVQMSLLTSVAKSVESIDSENDNLNIKISEYEKLLKKLKYENENLAKESEKYRNILEEINKQKQKQDKPHLNNIINLENKVKKLENECDELSHKLNKKNLPNKTPKMLYLTTSEEDQFTKSPIKYHKDSPHHTFRINHRSTTTTPTPFFSTFNTFDYSGGTTPIITNNNFLNEMDEYEFEVSSKEIHIDYEEDIAIEKISKRKIAFEKKCKKDAFCCTDWRTWFT